MQTGIKFQVKLPSDVKEWLKADADRNDRSMNGQVVAILRERMNQQQGQIAQQNEQQAR